MNRLDRASFVLGVVAFTLGAGCAGGIDGDVDGDPIPSFLSGAWTNTDEGDLVGVQVALATHLDVCGVSVRRFQGYAEAIDALTDAAKDGDNVDLGDVAEAMDDVDEAVLPGDDLWNLSTVLVADDEDEVAGERFDVDQLGAGSMSLTVCHQDGLPDRDDTLQDDNLECYAAIDGKLEVGGFNPEGGIDFAGDAEVVSVDDLVADGAGDLPGFPGLPTSSPDTDDIDVNGSAGACPDLEEARDDYNDALHDLLAELGPQPSDPPAGGSCSSSDQCAADGLVCSTDLGACVDPVSLLQCTSAGTFASVIADPSAPALFDATFTEVSSSSCLDGVAYQLDAGFFDFDGNTVDGAATAEVQSDAPVLGILDTTFFDGSPTGSVRVRFCLAFSTADVAVRIRDATGNASNVACAQVE